MIKLKIPSLRVFFKKAAFIERNELLPILANVKLEPIALSGGGTSYLLTKTDGNSSTLEGFIEGELTVREDHEPLLLDERVFSSLVAAAKTDEISIEIVDNKLFLTEGKSKVELPNLPAKDFPVTEPPPSGEETPFILSAEVRETLVVANAFVTKSETAGAFQFIHLYPEMIFAYHNNFFFVNTRYTGLPSTSIRAEEMGVITNSEGDLHFYDRDRFHIFRDGGYTFYFVKPETAPPKIAQVVERLQVPGKDFTLDKSEILDFCSIANIVAESEVALSTMTKEGGFMILKLVDANYARGTERMVATLGDFDTFNFNSRITLPPLKAIPYDSLNCKTNQNCLIVTGEKEYFCFIGMQK